VKFVNRQNFSEPAVLSISRRQKASHTLLVYAGLIKPDVGHHATRLYLPQCDRRSAWKLALLRNIRDKSRDAVRE
jgi:hypothetical protein